MEIFNYFQIFSHKCSVRSHLTLYGIITRFLKMFPSLLPCHSAFMHQVFPKSALLFSYTSSCNVLNTATPLLSNLVQRYICSRSPHLWFLTRKKCSQSPHNPAPNSCAHHHPMSCSYPHTPQSPEERARQQWPVRCYR